MCNDLLGLGLEDILVCGIIPESLGTRYVFEFDLLLAVLQCLYISHWDFNTNLVNPKKKFPWAEH